MPDTMKAVSAAVEKHVHTHHAINELDTVTNRIQLMIERSSGPTPTDPSGCQPTLDEAPNLVQLLNGAPDRIRNKIEQFHALLNELESLLFG